MGMKYLCARDAMSLLLDEGSLRYLMDKLKVAPQHARCRSMPSPVSPVVQVGQRISDFP
jgi:hypothetical protein